MKRARMEDWMRSVVLPSLAASLAACGPRTLPEAPQPAPAESAGRSANDGTQVCVLRNGALERIPVRIDAARGDTLTADGLRPSDVSPASGYAAGAEWYQRNEVIELGGLRHVQYGLARQMTAGLVRVGEYRGVCVYAPADGGVAPPFLFIPVRPGCVLHAYERPHAME